MPLHQLPIFKDTPPNPLGDVSPLPPDETCTRCAHSAGKVGTCMPHEGHGGGLLVVDSFPNVPEARVKRHLAGTLGQRLKQMASAAFPAVAYATALRCPPKGAAPSETAVPLVPALNECRPYLAHTVDTLKPKRIIALGAGAIYSLTGAMVTPSTMRGGFTWMHFAHGWVPVFYCVAPALANKNKFLSEWLLKDFETALTQEPLTAPPFPGETWANLVTDEATARRALESVAHARWTAVDGEWCGRPYDNDFKLLSIALTPAPHIPMEGGPADLTDPKANEAWVWTYEGLREPGARKLLSEWLRSPKHKKIGSYFKADTVAFHAGLGIWTRGVVFDTRLMRRLMDAEASGRLADMAHLVGRGGHKSELDEAKDKAVAEYRRKCRKAAGGLFKIAPPNLADQSHGDKVAAGGDKERDTYGFAFVDPELLYRYNAADTSVTSLLGARLEYMLAQEPEGMQHVAHTVATPAGDAYARIESWGMRVDREALQNVGTYLDMQTESLTERLKPYGYDPENPKNSDFDPASPSKIGRLLFDTLKLESKKLTDKGTKSTDVDALEALRDQHPVVNDILSWRGLHKMRSTYVDAMLGYLRDDGRVHPSIHPDGARTGRTSSSNPNFQNIPSVESADTTQAELARMFKDCFAPPAGHSLLEVDYSQLELRMAADLSGDPAMLDIFHQGQDYHLRTAQLLSKTLWNLEPDQVTDAHRREVKGVNFALLFDDDPFGIAFRLGTDKEKAEQLRDAVFGCFPLLGKWIKERVAEATRTGHAWTWWDGMSARRRPLIDVANLDSPAGKTARRGSWNTPIQGTGNEYLVASAIKVVDWLVGNGIPAKLLVTIHDSMLLEVRNDCMSEVYAKVLEIMCSHRTKNGVPLAADGKCGPTWAQMKKWKPGTPCPLEGCV